MANEKQTKSITYSTAKRALSLSKTYIALMLMFSVIALTLWNPYTFGAGSAAANTTSNSTLNATTNAILGNTVSAAAGPAGSSPKSYFLLAVPLDAIPGLMIATPLLLLFVYDKNNGVLEYLLSLGLTARDVYMRYLKAALLLVLIFLIVFTVVHVALSYVTHGMPGVAIILPLSLLSGFLALASSSFMMMCMMVFSSLQKTRTGSNQPLAAAIGWLGTLPAYLLPFIIPSSSIYLADAIMIAIIAIAAGALLVSSDRLISNEKLLP